MKAGRADSHFKLCDYQAFPILGLVVNLKAWNTETERTSDLRRERRERREKVLRDETGRESQKRGEKEAATGRRLEEKAVADGCGG